jgi:hypothetical protein
VQNFLHTDPLAQWGCTANFLSECANFVLITHSFFAHWLLHTRAANSLIIVSRAVTSGVSYYSYLGISVRIQKIIMKWPSHFRENLVRSKEAPRNSKTKREGQNGGKQRLVRPPPHHWIVIVS